MVDSNIEGVNFIVDPAERYKKAQNKNEYTSRIVTITISLDLVDYAKPNKKRGKHKSLTWDERHRIRRQLGLGNGNCARNAAQRRDAAPFW